MILYNILDGAVPWPELHGMKAARLAAYKQDRPVLPKTWSTPLRHLLSECWRDKAMARPTFEKIVTILAEYQEERYPETDINADGHSESVLGAKSQNTRSSGVGSGCNCVIL